MLVVSSLILAQAQLVWAAELHGHNELGDFLSRSTFVRKADSSSKAAAGRPSCVACQISRENTASAATGFPPLAPDLVARLRPAFSFLGLDLSSVIVLPARAPPIGF